MLPKARMCSFGEICMDISLQNNWLYCKYNAQQSINKSGEIMKIYHGTYPGNSISLVQMSWKGLQNITPRPKWSVPAVPRSVHCSYTAAYAVYLQYRLLIHCRLVSYGSIFVHCTYTASKWQCTCSVLAAYTAATLKLYCLYTPLRSGQSLS